MPWPTFRQRADRVSGDPSERFAAADLKRGACGDRRQPVGAAERALQRGGTVHRHLEWFKQVVGRGVLAQFVGGRFIELIAGGRELVGVFDECLVAFVRIQNQQFSATSDVLGKIAQILLGDRLSRVSHDEQINVAGEALRGRAARGEIAQTQNPPLENTESVGTAIHESVDRKPGAD